jgi:hypothetical protein
LTQGTDHAHGIRRSNHHIKRHVASLDHGGRKLARIAALLTEKNHVVVAQQGMAITLADLEYLMDLAFDEIAYCEYQLNSIPIGIIGTWDCDHFENRYTKEEQAYLKNEYALHHDIYLYVQRMLAEVDTLRNLYENITNDIFVKEAMEKSSLVFENTRKPNIGGEDLFSDEAFGEEFDWIC